MFMITVTRFDNTCNYTVTEKTNTRTSLKSGIKGWGINTQVNTWKKYGNWLAVTSVYG